MIKFKVLFYRYGKDRPVEAFFSRCTVSQQRKITRQMVYLAEFGLTKANPCLRKLGGTKMWELRILGKDNIRLVCIQKASVVVILNAFVKKKMKTPERELGISMRRWRNLDI